MSGEVYATKELWASYRCSLTPLYDALRQDTNPLPLLDQLREFGTNSPETSSDDNGENQEACGLLKLVVQVTGNGHFLDAVDSLPG